MEPGPLFFATLTQDATVGALLGTRIYPILAPPNTPFPYLTYQLISQQGEETMACRLDDNARVQLSLFATTYAQVCEVAAACRAALFAADLAPVRLSFDGNRDQPSDPQVCYFRTQDYLLEGLTP